MTSFASLEGKVAVVTGAGSGIGRASAIELARAGAVVLVTSRAERSARATADAIRRETRTEPDALAFDVTSAAQLARVRDYVASSYGRVDVLVASAGIDLAHEPGVDDLTDDAWRLVVETNLTSVFRLVRALLALLSRGASVITIGSANSVVGRANAAAYVASKGGVLQLTRALAIDLAARGIRANCVCPGNIDTPLTDRFLASSQDPERRRAEYAAGAPMRRLGTAQEVANCVRFIASDEASFVTGAALFVDGGLTAI